MCLRVMMRLFVTCLLYCLAVGLWSVVRLMRSWLWLSVGSMVYALISTFARASSSIEDFHVRNRTITEKLLSQGYRYHKLRKTFSKFYHRNQPLISKYKSNLKSFLRHGISHPEFYGDVIYKLRKIIGHVHFENLFRKHINKFLKRDYDPLILQRTSRLVVKPSTIDNYAFFFDCAMTDSH